MRKACLFNWKSHMLHFYIISIESVCAVTKGRSVAKRDNHPQMAVVKLAMLDLYCRQCLCWRSIQTLGEVFHTSPVWDRMDPICILKHVSNFYFAPCVRTLVSAIVLTVRGLCYRFGNFKTLASATTLKWICGNEILQQKRTEHPTETEHTTSDEDVMY